MKRNKQFKALLVSEATHELVKKTAFENKFRSMDALVEMLVKNYRIAKEEVNPMSSGGYDGGMR